MGLGEALGLVLLYGEREPVILWVPREEGLVLEEIVQLCVDDVLCVDRAVEESVGAPFVTVYVGERAADAEAVAALEGFGEGEKIGEVLLVKITDTEGVEEGVTKAFPRAFETPGGLE